jgi:uncharacterized membrane protein YbhN (UPF0104 family)
VNRTRLLANLAVATAVVAFFVYRADPGEIWHALKATDYRLAAVAVALNLPVALLAPLRSLLVFRRLGFKVPFSVLGPTTVLGFVAGGLTPAASGELLRAGALRSRAGVPVETTVAVVAYERILSLYLMAASAALVFAVMRLPSSGALVAVPAGGAALLLPWPAARLAGRLFSNREVRQGRGLARRLIGYVASVLTQIRSLLDSPGLLLGWSAVTIAMFGVIAAQYWILARGVAGGVSYGEAWVALGISTVAAVLSLVPFGAGVLDASLAASLHRFGTTLEQGGGVAVLVRATVTLPLVFGAFACYLYLQSAMRRSEEPAVQDVG